LNDFPECVTGPEQSKFSGSLWTARSGMAFPPILMKQLYYSDSGVTAHLQKNLSQNGRKLECGSKKAIFVKKMIRIKIL